MITNKFNNNLNEEFLNIACCENCLYNDNILCNCHIKCLKIGNYDDYLYLSGHKYKRLYIGFSYSNFKPKIVKINDKNFIKKEEFIV